MRDDDPAARRGEAVGGVRPAATAPPLRFGPTQQVAPLRLERAHEVAPIRLERAQEVSPLRLERAVELPIRLVDVAAIALRHEPAGPRALDGDDRARSIACARPATGR
jgi:hypothetical protein